MTSLAGLNSVTSLTQREVLDSMFFGTAIAFILHGITCCQVIWFFRTQSGSSKSMNALVTFAWLAESLNCSFIFCATLNSFFLPAITFATMHIGPCTDWTGPAQLIPSSMCTFAAEGFFIMRVWRLSEHKKLTMLAFIPYLAGFVFGLAQIGRSFHALCNLNASDILSPIFIFGAYCSRVVGDGVVAVTMCYMLYRRSSGFTRHANTIKIVHGLILCSISTGLLTWMVNIFYLLSYLDVVRTGFAIYYIRGGLYVNAMLAQLNARTRFRAIAEAPIPLSSIRLGETVTPSQLVDPPQLVDRELQPLRADPA